MADVGTDDDGLAFEPRVKFFPCSFGGVPRGPHWPARVARRRDAGRSTRALHLDMSGGYSAARARQDEYLASLVIRDARARADGVDKDGVLAYLHSPKTRERPNETFLANTLRGVRSANERDARRANDAERPPANGRGARRRDDRPDASPSPSSSTTPSSSSSPSPSASSRDGDAELAAFLSRPGRVRRGRGAVGSRADEPGPHLPPPSSSTRVRADGYAYVAEDPADEINRLGEERKAAERAAKRAKREKRKERKENKRKEERKERKRAKRRRRGESSER